MTTNGSPSLAGSGVAPLSAGVTREGEVTDPDALAAVLKDLFAESKLSRNVRVGIANQRVVVRTLRLPLIEDRNEVDARRSASRPPTTSRCRSTQAVLDWQVLEPTPETAAAEADGRRRRRRPPRDGVRDHAGRHAPRASARSGSTSRAFGMIRALAARDPPQPSPARSRPPTRSAWPRATPTQPCPRSPPACYCNLGDVTNLAVARGSTCLFTRISSFGIEGIAQRLAERRELTLEHARQWLIHVGLVTPVEEIEGDPEIVSACRQALDEGAAKLAGELRLSLDYYGAQEGAVAVEEIVVCGPGTAIAGLPEQLERELGYALRVGRPLAALATSTRSPPRGSRFPTDWRWRTDGCAPST